MVKASSGIRRGGRRRLRRGLRHKFTVERQMKEFKPNDKVFVSIDPSSMKGMPPLKYAGSVGIITSSRGKSYVLSVKKGNKKKEIVARPEHLRLM